jgi:hypothetical protein
MVLDINNQPFDNAHRSEKFIKNLMAGKDLRQAGLEAGYANPHRDAAKILLEKRAQDYAKRITKGKCILQGMPMAYDYLYRTMIDPRKDDRLRIVCAKEIIACGGLVPPRGAKAEEDAPNAPDKMNRNQLIAAIENAQKILAENAKLIEHTPQTLDSLM